MRIELLGVVQARDDSGDPVHVGGPRAQVLLALLALDAGRVVPVSGLVARMWEGSDPPEGARGALQSMVSRLRGALSGSQAASVIESHPAGYRLALGRDDVDALAFEKLAVQGARALAEGDAARASAILRDALALWRGPALAGLSQTELLVGTAARLEELRRGAVADRIDADLAAEDSDTTGLIAELRALVNASPLAERPRALLMRALYRAGRQADALSVYSDARAQLADQLGVDPSPELEQVYLAVLRRSLPERQPVPSSRAKGRAPKLLPAGLADFTGRAEQVGQIRRHLLSGTGGRTRLAVPVVAITGTGGVGKTALAVHTAVSVAGRFPGGQLFADMHAGTDPVGAARVLERFLRALGVPGPQVPETLDERAEMYRDLLAGRRILVVLDDAAGESHVAPLLPGGVAAGVLITSRGRLAGLAGALRIDLDVLDPDSSVQLLAGIAGADRVEAQSEAAAVVAGQCGHLPLALRVAGARLAARPHWSLAQLAERLADETRRLDELEHGDVGVRASISLSYDGVSHKAQRLLRRLVVLRAPALSGWMAGALLDQPPLEAADLLDELADARLVEPTGTGAGVQAQYQLHDLIQAFARERLAAQEPAAEQQAALERVLGALLYLAEEAHSRYFGGDHLRMQCDAVRWPLHGPLSEQLVLDSLAWYERERATLIAGVRQAAHAGLAELCWGLAASAAEFYEARFYLDDGREACQIALNAARKAGNVRGQAAMHYLLGSWHLLQRRRLDDARQELTEAARLFQGAGNTHDIAVVTRSIAVTDRLSGRLDEAVRGFEQALTLFQAIGDHSGTASAMRDRANVELDRGQPRMAMELLAEALPLCRTAGNERSEALTLSDLGAALLQTGDLDGAVEACEAALALFRKIGDLFNEAYALQRLGVARTRQGKLGPANELLDRSLQLADDLGDRLARGRALAGLSEHALASADPDQATAYARRAEVAFRELGAPLDEAQARTLLSRVRAAGPPGRA